MAHVSQPHNGPCTTASKHHLLLRRVTRRSRTRLVSSNAEQERQCSADSFIPPVSWGHNDYPIAMQQHQVCGAKVSRNASTPDPSEALSPFTAHCTIDSFAGQQHIIATMAYALH